MRAFAFLFLLAAQPLWAECAVPSPVLQLGYPSPYLQDDPTRSTIDPTAQAQMQAEIAPVDATLRRLAGLADQFDDPEKGLAAQHCVLRVLNVWAKALALQNFTSEVSEMTFGARLAGFALIARRLRVAGRSPEALEEVSLWLTGLARQQRGFWDQKSGAPSQLGNLRAWANLGIWTVGAEVANPSFMRWAAASHEAILCSIDPDGSLPAEMARGTFALHYQLHALAPLVTLEAMIAETTPEYLCSEAMARAVDFALSDLDTGARSAALSGVTQSYQSGLEILKPHELAWLEAFLSIAPSQQAEALAREYRPLRNSKLGGNQTEIWQGRGKLTDPQ